MHAGWVPSLVLELGGYRWWASRQAGRLSPRLSPPTCCAPPSCWSWRPLGSVELLGGSTSRSKLLVATTPAGPRLLRLAESMAPGVRTSEYYYRNIARFTIFSGRPRRDGGLVPVPQRRQREGGGSGGDCLVRAGPDPYFLLPTQQRAAMPLATAEGARGLVVPVHHGHPGPVGMLQPGQERGQVPRRPAAVQRSGAARAASRARARSSLAPRLCHPPAGRRRPAEAEGPRLRSPLPPFLPDGHPRGAAARCSSDALQPAPGACPRAAGPAASPRQSQMARASAGTPREKGRPRGMPPPAGQGRPREGLQSSTWRLGSLASGHGEVHERKKKDPVAACTPRQQRLVSPCGRTSARSPGQTGTGGRRARPAGRRCARPPRGRRS
jgi:hypothetical protein